MKLISTQIVTGGNPTQVQFSSIPQTGTDLFLIISASVEGGGMNADIRFNNNTATSYQVRRLTGTSSSTVTASTTSDRFLLQATGNPAAWGGYNGFSSAAIYILNYTGSTNKSISVDSANENNQSAPAYQELSSGTFLSTAAISSIQILADGGSNYFMPNTIFSLYTITKGSGGATVTTA
jgi:hypothetical protein